MTLKKVQNEVDNLNTQVKTVRNSVSNLKDEIAVLQSNLNDLKRMVSNDMKKIVAVVNNK